MIWVLMPGSGSKKEYMFTQLKEPVWIPQSQWMLTTISIAHRNTVNSGNLYHQTIQGYITAINTLSIIWRNVLSHLPCQLDLAWKTGHVRFQEHQPYLKSTLLIPLLQPHPPVCHILGSSTLMWLLRPQQSLTQALHSLLPRILQSQRLPQQIPEVQRHPGPSPQPNQQVLPLILQRRNYWNAHWPTSHTCNLYNYGNQFWWHRYHNNFYFNN